MTEQEKIIITKYDLLYEQRMTRVETVLETLAKDVTEIKTEELETKQIELEEKRLKKQNEVDLIIEEKELVEEHLNGFKNRNEESKNER